MDNLRRLIGSERSLLGTRTFKMIYQVYDVGSIDIINCDVLSQTYNMLKSVRDFISYWYLRYLLVTELYMVEKWERAMFHVVACLMVTILYVFNGTLTLGLVKELASYLFPQDLSKDVDTYTVNKNYEDL